MSSIKNNQINLKLNRHLQDAKANRHDAMEKLASGKVFTSGDPRPAERALSEQMDFRLRSLSSSKKNVNTAINLLQTAESSLSEINNIVMRMKELTVSAANTTVSNQERRYLFVEYEALHDEMNRIAVTTEFNGLPLLNGEADEVPEELIFRVDDPHRGENTVSDAEDINTIRFDGLKNVVATTEGLGIQSARPLLEDSSIEDGIDIEDVEDLMAPEEDIFPTAFDEALNRLSTQRAVFGALQSRLNHSNSFIDVYTENIAAAKSTVADTDYAKETIRLAESNILMHATTGLLAQSNVENNVVLNLLSSVNR